MATTGFWPVRGRLKEVIDYARNPDKTTESRYLDPDLYSTLRYTEDDQKTDEKLYVSGINCSKYTACEEMMAVKRHFGERGRNIAYHGYQSFAAGEVTPEEAHKIGIETARRMWGERYQVIVTTHLNTDNLHNHFVVNSVSFKDGVKFRDKIGDHFELRKISDAICRERGKSVLEHSSFYGGDRSSYWAKQKGTMSHRDMLRRDMDLAIEHSKDESQFLKAMQQLGYTCDRTDGYAHATWKSAGWKRPIRADGLGSNYTPDAIRDRIEKNNNSQCYVYFLYLRTYRTPVRTFEKELRAARKMDGMELAFQLLFEIVRLCTGNRKVASYYTPLSPELRHELARLDQYTEDVDFLGKHHISTMEQLNAFQNEQVLKLEELEHHRYLIRNKIRRAEEPEKEILKEEAKSVTQEMVPIRKLKAIADRIEERSRRLDRMLDTERRMEDEVLRERTKPKRERSYER